MRIAIDHRSQYRFSKPQARIVQLLRVTPCDTEYQTVVNWRIDVDVDARLRRGVDGYGNIVTMLYAEGPIESLEINVTGEVLTTEATGVVRGGAEPLPPMLFLRSTPRTLASVSLAEFAEAASADSSLGRLHALNAALHARFPCTPDTTDTGITAAEAFTASRATSRDVAQMMVAAARHLHIPARYVSGYRSDGEAHGAPHAWAEAHIDDLGWVGFDPATGLSPDASYVRVAVGLDATAAASIAGTRIGQGEEALDVDLHVDEIGSQD